MDVHEWEGLCEVLASIPVHQIPSPSSPRARSVVFLYGRPQGCISSSTSLLGQRKEGRNFKSVVQSVSRHFSSLQSQGLLLIPANRAYVSQSQAKKKVAKCENLVRVWV